LDENGAGGWDILYNLFQFKKSFFNKAKNPLNIWLTFLYKLVLNKYLNLFIALRSAGFLL